MKIKYLLSCAALIMLGYLTAPAMPFHPDMLKKIQSGEIVLPANRPSTRELKARGIDNPQIWALNKSLFSKNSRLLTSAKSAKGPTGEFKALVILLDFSDNVASVNPADFDTLVFDTLTGVNHYYRKVSYGNLDIITVHYPSSTGWLRAPQTYAYYVDGQYGFGTYPQNAQKMVEDAVVLADAAGVDFSQYDNDGDNYVDALFVVHAGQGREYTGSADDIHSHAWSTSAPVLLDGVYVYNYSTEPEYWATPGDMTIGVYCHELGHALFNLPDMYDYDYDSQGLGDWSLMAFGSWNGPLGSSPAFPDAYNHCKMGYVTPVNVLTNITGQTIKAVEDTAQIFRLWTNGIIGNQYYLVENRQQTDYDSYLPAGGLHIYHVDEGVSDNGANDNQWYPGYTSYGHYKVALEQADGLWELEQDAASDASDPYPGTAAKTVFDSSTTPGSRDYNAAGTKVQVRSISVSAASMTADLYVNDGTEPVMATDKNSFSVSVPPEDSLAEILAIGNIGASDLAWRLTYSKTGLVNYDGDNSDGIGTNSAETFTAAARFTAAELTAYYGSYELYGVSIVVYQPSYSAVTLKVWKGGASGDPGTEIYSQNVTAQITPAGWSDLTLTAPIALDTAGEYWVGYEVAATGGYPLGCDAGPEADEKGQWIYYGGVWYQLKDLNAALTYNWNIRARLGKRLSAWLTLDPDSGTVTPAGSENVAFKFTAAGLAEGVYSDTVCLASNDPASNPRKIPVSMTVEPSGVAGRPETAVPTVFALQNAWPNPVRGSVNFKYQLPCQASPRLTVFNVLGQAVKTFDPGRQEPGYHTIKWNDLRLAPGVYFYRLQAGAYSSIRKLAVVK